MHVQIKASGLELATPLGGSPDGGPAPGDAPLTLRLHASMAPLETVWRTLSAAQSLSLHQGYDWCRAWAETHNLEVLVLEGLCDGRTQLLLPLEIQRHGPVRIARLLGTDFSNINTGLFSEDFRSPAAAARLDLALQAARGTLARAFDLLLLEKMPFAWRETASPFAGLPATRNQNSAFQLELFADFEETLAQLNAKRRRKKYRNSERRLMAMGGFEHVVAAPGEEALALLEIFFRQKSTRFEAMGLPDVFRDEETRNFFRTLAAMPATEDGYCLQLQALRLGGAHDGHIAAITGLSRKGDHVICQFGSIDDNLAADASPGEFLFHLAIQRVCSEGARLFDFGIGDQPYKRSWCRIETPHHDILLPVTMAGRAAAATHRAKTAAKRLIKQNPQIYSLVQRLRFGRKDAPATGESD
ncbi:GNAT family N-acetyltransferase [Shinella sp. G-2]|uniref:GNAT family N-acetyltransferase n=1 Tax=Shinella sp. G-2 TaxID=3133141 RepID=UPI003D04F81B